MKDAPLELWDYNYKNNLWQALWLCFRKEENSRIGGIERG